MNTAKQLYKIPEQPVKHGQRIYNAYLEDEGRAAAEKALERFTKSVAANPSAFWCPNGPQERLINTFADSINTAENPSDIATLICTFANGVGKTELMQQLIVNLIYGPQNGWFDQDIFKKWDIPKRIWYCSTPSQLKNKVVTGIVGALTKASANSKVTYEISKVEMEMKNIVIDKKNDSIKFDKAKGHHEWIQRIECSNGWSIFFFSYNQSPKELEGDEVGLIINDEPAPEPFNKAQKSRRRMGNITIHVMTPLYCDPYLVHDYKEAKEKNIQGMFALEGSVYEASMSSEGVHCGIRGHLDPTRIDRMVEEYDADERDARAFGRFMFFSTRIYPTFTRDIHSAKPLPEGFDYHGRVVIIPPGSILKMANDPKDGTYDAVMWFWKFPNGRMYFFAESPMDNSKYYWKMKDPKDQRDKLLEWIKIEKMHKMKVDRRIIDKIFGIEQTRANTHIADQYYEEGQKLSKELDDPNIEFFFFPSHGKADDKGMLKYRHESVRKALKVQPDGMPLILFSTDCVHGIRGMENYIRSYSINALEKSMEIDAPPVPKFKDFPDAIGFACCDEIDYKGTDKIETTAPDKKDDNWAKSIF